MAEEKLKKVAYFDGSGLVRVLVAHVEQRGDGNEDEKRLCEADVVDERLDIDGDEHEHRHQPLKKGLVSKKESC